VSRRRVRASPTSLLAGLKAFGAHVDGPEDIAEALRARTRELWERPLEPVLVAWGGRFGAIRGRLPLWVMDARRRWTLALEGGEDLNVTDDFDTGAHGVIGSAQVDGSTFVEMEFVPQLVLPAGYHSLRLEFGASDSSSLVVSAPRKARQAAGGPAWGAFLPLYALRTRRSWGLGDLTDFGDLLEWMSGLGGNVAATLPFLSAFLSAPFEPSPYSPASRLFWNELYLDVTKVPELERSPEARAMLRSRRLREEIEALQAAPLVDHRGAMAAKRGILEVLARSFFADSSRRPEGFNEFARDRTVEDYASFRANCERRGTSWWTWPHRERDGVLSKEGGHREAFRYHVYVQWLMAVQMHELGRRAAGAGANLYFDFPLGVSPEGYDVWRERPVFALGAATGAPPDSFFTGGQDWGFPPLHPERIRRQGYRYVIACLRHMLRHAGVLRIDHVMSLHRLYWVPRGLDARQGVYVRYRPEELYAILALESTRSSAVIVGEDLGTVPESVRRAMQRHGVYRSFVLEMELKSDPRRAINPAPRSSLAALDTHDMPPFAGFWKDLDLWVRDALVRYLRSEGWLPRSPGGKDSPRVEDVLKACLAHLAAGEAHLLLVNLEDLWLEEQPQNVPGTTNEYPNWRRPARYPFERFRQMRRVTGTLKRVDRLRKRGEQS